MAGGEEQDGAQRQRLGAPHAEVVVDLSLAPRVGQGRHLGSSMTTACDGAGGRSGAALGPRWRRRQTPPPPAAAVPTGAAERCSTPRGRGGAAAAALPASPLPLGRRRAAPALGSPPRGGRLGAAGPRGGSGAAVDPPGLGPRPAAEGAEARGGCEAGTLQAPGASLLAVGSLGLCSMKVYLGEVRCLRRCGTAGTGQCWLFPQVLRFLSTCRSSTDMEVVSPGWERRSLPLKVDNAVQGS